MDGITNNPAARAKLDSTARQALQQRLITPRQFEELTKPATKPGELARDLQIGRAVLERVQGHGRGSQLELARALFAAAEQVVVTGADLTAVTDEAGLAAQRQTVLTALSLEATKLD